MENSTVILAWAGASVTTIILGANWFIQAKILNCSAENRGKLARWLQWLGLTFLAVGLGILLTILVLILRT